MAAAGEALGIAVEALPAVEAVFAAAAWVPDLAFALVYVFGTWTFVVFISFRQASRLWALLGLRLSPFSEDRRILRARYPNATRAKVPLPKILHRHFLYENRNPC